MTRSTEQFSSGIPRVLEYLGQAHIPTSIHTTPRLSMETLMRPRLRPKLPLQIRTRVAASFRHLAAFENLYQSLG